MARPIKQGIDYFPFDVDFFSDVKIRKIIRACGSQSTSILICLLCNIYKDKGYYILWDEDLPFVIADTVGVSEGAVKEVILKALQVDFFNQELYDKYKILTSSGIQSRFKAAVYKRKEIEYIIEYLVSDVGNVVNDIRNAVNDVGSTQSKVKVKRKNNTTPSPPSKGGGRRQKSEPKEINSKARSLFKKYFKDIFSNDYYWTAKDAGAMTKLLQKIAFSREQKKMPIDDESLLYAFQSLLSSIHDDWILNNFSVAIINSKYNEIVNQAINGNNRKSCTNKHEANVYAMQQYIAERQRREQGLVNEVEKPF